jgi:hypothetical protein
VAGFGEGEGDVGVAVGAADVHAYALVVFHTFSIAASL